MDMEKVIIELLGIQDVKIIAIKKFKKDLRLEIKLKQNRADWVDTKFTSMTYSFAEVAGRWMEELVLVARKKKLNEAVEH